MRVVEPGHDALGAAFGKAAHVGLHVNHVQVVLQGQRGYGAAGGVQLLGPALGLNGDKRQGVTARGLEQESGLGLGVLGLPEAVVDGLHQRVGGAVVDIQRVMPPLGGGAGLQVAVDVGPAKAVDGLLGVADEQQRPVAGVGLGVVNPVEQAVLQR